MCDRRTLLQSLAVLPLAAVPTVALSNRVPAGSVDPFTTFHQRIVAVLAAIEAPGTEEEEANRLMDRWAEINREAMAARPVTLAGAIGALEYARREFHQFHIETREDIGGQPCPGDTLVLHLLDGALGVLRQAVDGGTDA